MLTIYPCELMSIYMLNAVMLLLAYILSRGGGGGGGGGGGAEQLPIAVCSTMISSDS